MSVRGAIFLGVGSMVGAGIFALLGEAGAVAGAAVWMSFLFAGIVAGLLGYTAVKLGVRFPSSGGVIAYLVAGFGNGRLVGIAAWLGYIAAIVIVGAMVAVSFGAYATSLFIGNDAGPAWDNVFTTIVVLGTLGINLVGSRIVDKAQTTIVLVLLTVFAVFIAVTITSVDWGLLAFSNYPPLFGHRGERRAHLLRVPGLQRDHVRRRRPRGPGARAAEGDVHGARHHGHAVPLHLPRGVRDAPGQRGRRLRRDRDRRGGAAHARRCRVHDDGHRRVAGDDLVDERDAVRVRQPDGDARRGGQFPPVFGAESRLGRHAGLLVTAGLVLVVANLVDLSAIASVGSAIALAVFLLVALAGYRRRGDTGANTVIAIAAIVVTAVVLGSSRWTPSATTHATFVAIVVIAVLAVVFDAIWRRRTPVTDAGSEPGPVPA